MNHPLAAGRCKFNFVLLRAAGLLQNRLLHNWKGRSTLASAGKQNLSAGTPRRRRRSFLFWHLRKNGSDSWKHRFMAMCRQVRQPAEGSGPTPGGGEAWRWLACGLLPGEGRGQEPQKPHGAGGGAGEGSRLLPSHPCSERGQGQACCEPRVPATPWGHADTDTWARGS